jgi:hypothetical protein
MYTTLDLCVGLEAWVTINHIMIEIYIVMNFMTLLDLSFSQQ